MLASLSKDLRGRRTSCGRPDGNGYPHIFPKDDHALGFPVAVCQKPSRPHLPTASRAYSLPIVIFVSFLTRRAWTSSNDPVSDAPYRAYRTDCIFGIIKPLHSDWITSDMIFSMHDPVPFFWEGRSFTINGIWMILCREWGGPPSGIWQICEPYFIPGREIAADGCPD